MKVMTVLGTRPELIRLGLVFREFETAGIEHVLVHTGQNYDQRLSEIFFDELELPAPDAYLGVRSDRVGEQIGQIIAQSEAVMLEQTPNALLVLGDTNSGLASIAAARLGIPVFHMEAGNRCFDWTVPEEKNRKLIDHISDWLLPYTPRAREYLLAEGIDPTRISVTGNPITDVLDHYRSQWQESDVLVRLGLEPRRYILVTAHRQETVDVPHRLRALCAGLSQLTRELDLPIVWSVHPRTRARLDAYALDLDPAIRVEAPFGFIDFIALEASAACVVTDSGTVQEECSLLNVPAVTCRDSTERPETIECGSNVLCGVEDSTRMLSCVQAMMSKVPDWRSPYAGDHGVAGRVTTQILSEGSAAARARPLPVR